MSGYLVNPEAVSDPNQTPRVYLGEEVGRALGIKQRPLYPTPDGTCSPMPDVDPTPAQLAALRSERDAARVEAGTALAERDEARAERDQLTFDLTQARRDAASWEDWGRGRKGHAEAGQVERDKAWADLDRLRPVLDEVAAERTRQDEKWGEQNHPDGTGLPGDAAMALADRAKCKANGPEADNWRDILQEEVSEAFAEDDPATLRGELIQVAAVAVQWVQAIDRRTARSEP